MSEVELLQTWLSNVAELKKWPPANEWSNHEFQVLSDEISQKSGILISRNTLRKLATHLSQGRNHTPRMTTKDALAVYIGFTDWKQYKNSFEQFSPTPRKKKYLPWFIAVISTIVLATVIVLYLAHNRDSNTDYNFEILNPIGNVPHTIECKYNFRNIKSDDIKVDFGHIDPTGKYLLVDLSKNDSIHKACFHYPGSYNIRLFIDKKTVKEEKVWINSEGWFTYVVDIRPNRLKDNVPDWLRKAGVQLEHIPFDAIIKPEITNEGYIHIPENAIEKLGSISNNFHTHYKYYKDFGTERNNFV